MVGYHTGARRGELVHLTWDQIDFDNNQIILHPGTTKNRQGRTLPIYGEMREWLLIEKETRDALVPRRKFVFHVQGEPIGGFYKSWHSACVRAGVPGLHFHDLRRSAVRNMVRAGVTEKVSTQISGHKTRSVFDRHNIVSDRDLREAASKLNSYLGE